ncbi:PAS domain S-box protein, partial [Halomonas sp.]|uniref:PAS domain S-box protein n=1 Tax=Halomonas sp. TaxID=1486246 RepID=UPI00356347F2
MQRSCPHPARGGPARCADALNCEEERFRSTIDPSPVATIMVDENGIIRMANQLAHSVFRCPE